MMARPFDAAKVAALAERDRRRAAAAERSQEEAKRLGKLIWFIECVRSARSDPWRSGPRSPTARREG